MLAETIDHLVSGCPNQPSIEYKLRHDKIENIQILWNIDKMAVWVDMKWRQLLLEEVLISLGE